MLNKDISGSIFNIQKFSVHDGSGIRTLVFLKGCPLKCLWCANPESQSVQPEKALNPHKCISVEKCGRCINACELNNISCIDNIVYHDIEHCISCNMCVKACPSGARQIYGETMTVDYILNKVEEDDVFYSRSGGGLTLSGGEPTMQKDFCIALLSEAKKRHIHTAIETCGYCSWETLSKVASLVNEIFFDIKSLDKDKFKKFIGVDNTLIIDNFTKLHQNFENLPIHVRTPVIPTFNDTEADIAAICNIIPKKEKINYELLPFHRMGQSKYEYLGKEYFFADAKLDKNVMESLVSYVQNAMKIS